MCLLRVFVFNWHKKICHTVCNMCLFLTHTMQNICHTVCHTPRTELAACLDNRTLGGLNTLNTREPSCVSCPSNVCNVYNSDSHLVSMGLHTHIRIAWATMGLATVRRPLVTPFWGLSTFEVINTYLHFVFLSFLLDPFSHLRVLKRRQSWDNRFGTLWWISVHLYMKWCIWVLRFLFGIGLILYFLGGTLWWVESGH